MKFFKPPDKDCRAATHSCWSKQLLSSSCQVPTFIHIVNKLFIAFSPLFSFFFLDCYYGPAREAFSCGLYLIGIEQIFWFIPHTAGSQWRIRSCPLPPCCSYSGVWLGDATGTVNRCSSLLELNLLWTHDLLKLSHHRFGYFGNNICLHCTLFCHYNNI